MHEKKSEKSEIAQHTEEIATLERQSGTAARLFDVRTVIGGLFVVYGLLIAAAGFSPGEEALRKAQGININLWTGLAMLLVGLLFLLWLKWRPLAAADDVTTAEE